MSGSYGTPSEALVNQAQPTLASRPTASGGLVFLADCLRLPNKTCHGRITSRLPFSSERYTNHLYGFSLGHDFQLLSRKAGSASRNAADAWRAAYGAAGNAAAEEVLSDAMYWIARSRPLRSSEPGRCGPTHD